MKQTMRWPLWIMLAAVLSACGTHRLHQAQESFERATRFEAQSSVGAESLNGTPLVAESQALVSYRLALSLTEEAIDEYESELKNDQLLGTALMLKALCSWRIEAVEPSMSDQEFKALIAAIKNQLKSEELILGTRDGVLLCALPGLREYSAGLHAAAADRARALFESALFTFDSCLTADVPEEHSVRTYIGLVQLRCVRAWKGRDARPADSAAETAWEDSWLERYCHYREALVSPAERDSAIAALLLAADTEFGWDSTVGCAGSR